MKKKSEILMLNSKQKTENENSERKVKLMVILSGLSYLISHLPNLIVSLLIGISYDTIQDGKKYFNKYREESYLLSILVETIYFLSFSFDFFLFYTFNKNFKLSFESMFKKNK
jgi:NADH:ubiquinone oxidoreductase subunit 4 (subunit M)